MGIRREEEMEMSDDEIEDPAETKETEESGTVMLVCIMNKSLPIVWTFICHFPRKSQ